MSKNNENKNRTPLASAEPTTAERTLLLHNEKYESFKLPDRKPEQDSGAVQPSPKPNEQPISSHNEAAGSFSDGMFYEIEYDSGPVPGVGKFVPKPQKIIKQEKDEVRERFEQMREIAKAHRSKYDFRRFFDRRIHQDNAEIFYKQGMLMKDFSDNYSSKMQFSGYFPYYQMMGYEQLRTYFTWRTEVRKGNVADTSLSYAFLYIYELLGNIGVNDPQDGLEKLMLFWKAFNVYNKTIDKYMLRWLKDYHIYYELPQSFKEFIKINSLTEQYGGMADTENSFDLFCSVSKYDIRKSTFFTDDKKKMIMDCFYFVTGKLRQIFEENSIHFDESIFSSVKNMSVWIPFRNALFYDWLNQPDRQIVLSANEIYRCSQNKWVYSTVITTESGRQLIGYVMKQMEAALRKIMKYKFKLSANINTVTHTAVCKLNEAGLSLESIINDAVMEFYREATKTVVKVDIDTLSVIRQEALEIQEKLIVPEHNDFPCGEVTGEQAPSGATPLNIAFTTPQEMPTLENEPATSDAWEGLKNILTETEIKALSVVLNGEIEIKKFADECGIMLEVLVDGINEKAMDYIGDNLMDEDFVLYDDYKEQVKELIK